MSRDRLIQRPRRLRATQSMRDLVAETRLDKTRFMQPHFVADAPERLRLLRSTR